MAIGKTAPMNIVGARTKSRMYWVWVASIEP